MSHDPDEIFRTFKKHCLSATPGIRLLLGWEGSSGQSLRDAAAQLGISLVFMLPEKGTPAEIERVFAAME